MSDSIPKEDNISEIEKMVGGEAVKHILNIKDYLDKLEEKNEGCVV